VVFKVAGLPAGDYGDGGGHGGILLHALPYGLYTFVYSI